MEKPMESYHRFLPIPKSVSNLKNLAHVYLYDCQFTQFIPSTLANLTELTYIDLSRNYFTNSISPIIFRGLWKLVHLDLRSNSFSRHIHQSLFTLPSLLNFHLYGNFRGKLKIFVCKCLHHWLLVRIWDIIKALWNRQSIAPLEQ